MYVDGFVAPVPKNKLDDYKAHANETLAVWMDHGAISAVESVADDVPDGVMTSFPMAVKLEPGEVVVFSFITYRDRAHRDEVNTKVFADPRTKRFAGDSTSWPFDGRRMIYGGFSAMIIRGNVGAKQA